MIIFYNKKTGDIFGTIDGRVHPESQLNMYAKREQETEEEVGKYIIGAIKNKEKTIEYNMDKMDLLKKFEDISSESPLDYKIKDGQIIKISK